MQRSKYWKSDIKKNLNSEMAKKKTKPQVLSFREVAMLINYNKVEYTLILGKKSSMPG